MAHRDCSSSMGMAPTPKSTSLRPAGTITLSVSSSLQMCGVFQPLNVDFFNHLKHHFSWQIDDYQLGSFSSRVPKTFFYRWFQRAWAQTETSKQIWSAWAKAGLYPLNQVIMCARPITPPPHTLPVFPQTPQTPRNLRVIDRAVCRGEIHPKLAFRKTEKALEKVLTEKVLLEQDLARREAVEELDRAAKCSKRTRLPQEWLFDQKYQEEHPEELAAQKEAEIQADLKRKREERARHKLQRSNLVRQSSPSPSTPDPSGVHVATTETKILLSHSHIMYRVHVREMRASENHVGTSKKQEVESIRGTRIALTDIKSRRFYLLGGMGTMLAVSLGKRTDWHREEKDLGEPNVLKAQLITAVSHYTIISVLGQSAVLHVSELG